MNKLKYPLLIDGGLSNELEQQGCDLNHKLWSAKILDSNPEAIVKTHLTYLSAGAKCITTCSYQATIPGFLSVGFSKKNAEKLIRKSVLLAEKAVKLYLEENKEAEKPLIAASIGPYGAYLADGSEYRGNYGISDDELYSFHKSRIDILENSNADIFAIETIPDYNEAKILVDILKKSNKQAWISFSCKDEKHINDGTNIAKCVELIEKHPTIFAVGVNCTAPKYISGLVEAIKASGTTKKIIIYPNSGEAYHAKSKTWVGVSNPESFVKLTKEWINLGADIVGGCCRIGVNHINGIAELISEMNK